MGDLIETEHGKPGEEPEVERILDDLDQLERDTESHFWQDPAFRQEWWRTFRRVVEEARRLRG